MSDAPTPAPPPPDADVAAGKVLAILGYIPALWIIALVMLIVRNNKFSLYHAKQACGLFLAAIACSIPMLILIMIVGMVIGAVTKGAGLCLVPVLWAAYSVGLLCLAIIGIINAANGVMKPLPVIGPLADKIFASIQVKT
jgi:uncharacterized membrane protein